MTKPVKKLNPKQAKFVELYTAGGMSRAEAYMGAYGQGNCDTARKNAYNLIATNSDVREEIERILDEGLKGARERLKAEIDPTLEKLFDLREMGNRDYVVQFQACKDILDRAGLKPKEEVEHSGEVNVNLLDVMLLRAKRAGGSDE